MINRITYTMHRYPSFWNLYLLSHSYFCNLDTSLTKQLLSTVENESVLFVSVYIVFYMQRSEHMSIHRCFILQICIDMARHRFNEGFFYKDQQFQFCKKFNTCCVGVCVCICALAYVRAFISYESSSKKYIATRYLLRFKWKRFCLRKLFIYLSNWFHGNFNPIT